MIGSVMKVLGISKESRENLSKIGLAPILLLAFVYFSET